MAAIPRKMQLSDIQNVVEMTYDAVEDSQDPLLLYLRDTTDAARGYFSRHWRLDVTMSLTRAVHDGTAWTVGDADGMMIYEAAGQASGFLDKLVNASSHYFDMAASSLLLSREQKRRRRDYIKKCDEVVTKTLKDRKKDMICLGGLATRPSKQKHGYGSALVRIVTAKADSEGRATWLISSNSTNTRFYNSLGFITQADIVLGDGELSCPTVMNLMVRESVHQRT